MVELTGRFSHDGMTVRLRSLVGSPPRQARVNPGIEMVVADPPVRRSAILAELVV